MKSVCKHDGEPMPTFLHSQSAFQATTYQTLYKESPDGFFLLDLTHNNNTADAAMTHWLPQSRQHPIHANVTQTTNRLQKPVLQADSSDKDSRTQWPIILYERPKLGMWDTSKNTSDAEVQWMPPSTGELIFMTSANSSNLLAPILCPTCPSPKCGMRQEHTQYSQGQRE